VATNDITLTWNGAADFDKRLSKLNINLQHTIAKKAVRSAAAYYRKKLQAKIPLGPPPVHLRKLISIVKINSSQLRFLGGYKRDKTTGFRIGYRGKARYYGHLHEFGGRGGRLPANRTWTKTFSSEAQNMLDIMASEIRAALN